MEFVHRVYGHDAVVDLLSYLPIIQIVFLAGDIHGQHSSHHQQGYPSEISHTLFYYNCVAKLQINCELTTFFLLFYRI